MLQETHLFAEESENASFFHPLLALGCVIFLNNNPNNVSEPIHCKAGTLTILTPSLLENYIPSKIPLLNFTRGFIQPILLTPVDADSHIPFRIINTYLYCGEGKNDIQKKLLEATTVMPGDIHTFMGGDFNFVIDHYTPSSLVDAWNKVCNHFNLTEAFQEMDLLSPSEGRY